MRGSVQYRRTFADPAYFAPIFERIFRHSGAYYLHLALYYISTEGGGSKVFDSI